MFVAMERPEMNRLNFRAMGCEVEIIVVGPEDLVDEGRRHVARLELLWSRFLADSEVNRLNAHAGVPVEVSAETRLLVRCGIEAWRATGGAFDPTMLDAIVRAGYDRSFDDLDPIDRMAWEATGDLLPGYPPAPLAIATPGCTDIEVTTRTVRLPRGIGFDPGGIGKGLAADLVACGLMASGASGVCVNIGGDLRVIGESPSGSGWTIAVEHPWTEEPVATIGLRHGAVATSSVLRRVWSQGGAARHHLLDPSTGEPTRSDLALASVITAEAWLAEAHAKAVLVRGSGRSSDLLDEASAALAVTHSGAILHSETLPRFTGDVVKRELVASGHRRHVGKGAA